MREILESVIEETLRPTAPFGALEEHLEPGLTGERGDVSLYVATGGVIVKKTAPLRQAQGKL
jgi:hypothetical protein